MTPWHREVWPHTHTHTRTHTHTQTAHPLNGDSEAKSKHSVMFICFLSWQNLLEDWECVFRFCVCIWSSVCSLCVCFRKAQQMSAIIKHHGATAVCITTHTNTEQHTCSQSAVYTTPLPFRSLSVAPYRHFTLNSWATKEKTEHKNQSSVSQLRVSTEWVFFFFISTGNK